MTYAPARAGAGRLAAGGLRCCAHRLPTSHHAPRPTPQRTSYVTTVSSPPRRQPPAPAALRWRSVGLAAHADARAQPGTTATAPAATDAAGSRTRRARGDRPAIARRAHTADRTRSAGADAERGWDRVASGSNVRRRQAPAGRCESPNRHRAQRRHQLSGMPDARCLFLKPLRTGSKTWWTGTDPSQRNAGRRHDVTFTSPMNWPGSIAWAPVGQRSGGGRPAIARWLPALAGHGRFKFLALALDRTPGGGPADRSPA